MENNNRKKTLAIALVLMMAMSSIIVLGSGNDDLDAAVGDGGSYSYTITYDSSVMSSTSAAISTANMTAISHTGTPTTVSSMNEGSWTWNNTTGKGPFNSFYGAFDIQNGNRFYAVLNPYDLTETIDGEDLPTPLTRWNIMWVLPTVYISSTATTLTLSNDSSSGTAYAHTINGHVYKYIAIGVYEGSTTTLNNATVLTSTTGTTPTAIQTRATFQQYAHNYTMSSTLNNNPSYPAYSMIWNFDQWQLFKSCCLTLMENFNSQNVVGNGHVFTNNPTYAYTTGALNSSGPYAGLPAQITDDASALAYGSDSVKLFIENAWGGLWDFVGGAVFDGRSGVYIDSSSNPDDSLSGTYVTHIEWASPIQNGYPISIQSDNARIWGFQGSTVGGSDTTGTADYIFASEDSNRVLRVGGGAWSDWGNSVRYGLSYSSVSNDLSIAYDTVGSRLAFVFDSGVPVTVDIEANNNSYGTVDVSQLQNVPYGSTVTVNGNQITINGTTITATPSTDTAQYDYGFVNWSVSNGQAINADTVITAYFNRQVVEYTVTIQSNNTDYGTVDVGSIPDTPYGSIIHLSGEYNNIMTINNTVVTATANDPDAEYRYGFDGYETDGQLVQDGDIITGNQTIIAYFSATNIYTVMIQSNNTDYGTVSVGQVVGVPSGNIITIDGNELTVNGVTSIAYERADTAQYTYDFVGFDVVSGTAVTDNMVVTATFTRTLNDYDITIQSNNDNYGTVDYSQIQNVDYGTVITVSDDELTVNGVTVTATPETDTEEYIYDFVGWSVTSGTTVTGDMTITASFTRSEIVTVTIQSNNIDYGTVDVSEIQVLTGTVIHIDGYEMTIGETVITASLASPLHNLFSGWSVSDGTIVTGDMTITAYFIEKTDMVSTLIDLIPLLVIIAIIMLCVNYGLQMYAGNYAGFVTFVLGVVIAVIVVAYVMLPTIGGL